MLDIKAMSNGLVQADDGIWYSKETEAVSYPDDGNEACFAIEDNSFWFQHRNNCIVTAINNYPPANSGPIFDIGGGNGFVSAGMAKAGYEVVLVEPGAKGASQAKSRGIEHVVCATSDTAKFKPHSLPAVGLFDVIEHIEDDLAFLKSMNKLIQCGGYLYATVPSYNFLWSDEDNDAHHYRRYNLSQIIDVFKAAGFEMVFSSYIFRFLPFAIFPLRVLPYRLGLTRSGSNEERASQDHGTTGGRSVQILNALLNPELKNLAQNKSMRFGASCLLVAKTPGNSASESE